jgi:hypothetical protein
MSISSALVDALADAKVAAVRDLSTHYDINRARCASITPTTIAPFAEALGRDARLRDVDDKWAFTPGGGGARLTLATCAVYLIDRAIEVDPALIISDLLRFAVDRTIVVREVRSVEGLTVPHPIKLDAALALVPASALKNDGPAAQIFSDANVPKHGYGSPPSAAIVRGENFHVVLTEPPTGTLPPPMRAPQSLETERIFRDAMSAVVLASTGAPHFRQSYSIVDSPGWPWMAAPGFGGSEPFPILVPASITVDECRVVSAFKALRSFGNDLGLAIGKLEASRRRLRLDERMVDLGTALEIVLMHGAESSGEIINKVATRAAWLLGHSAEHRLNIFTISRDLYAERSKVVHSGQLKNVKNPAFPGDDCAYAAYDKLIADVIFAVAERGKWPEWSKLVLNAE